MPNLKTHFEAQRLSDNLDELAIELPITVFADAFRRSFPEKPDKELRESDLGITGPLSEALLNQTWSGDNHCVAYYAPKHPGVRLTYDYLRQGLGPVYMSVFVVDVDTPGHVPVTDEWLQKQAALLQKVAKDDEHWGLPAAFYPTKNGLRVIWPLEKPACLQTVDDAAAWSRWYTARLRDLNGFGVNASADERCKDWTRFFRLPNVLRDGEKQPSATVLLETEDWDDIGFLEFDPPTPEEAFSEGIDEGVSPNPKRTAALVELLRSIYPDLESGTCNEFRLASTGWLLRWGLGDVEIVAALNEARRRKGPLKGNWKETEARVAGQRHKLISGEPLLGRTRMVELGEDPLPEKLREKVNQEVNEARVQKALDYLKKHPQHVETFERMKAPLSAEQHSENRIRAAISKFEDEHLKAQLLKDRDGASRGCIENLTRILRDDTRWAGVLGFEKFGNQEVWCRAPRVELGIFLDLTKPIQDAQVDAIQRWITREYDLAPTVDSTHRAVTQAAHANAFDSVLDELNSLKWDGVPRLETWLIDAAGCEDSEYTRAVSSRFLISLVARAFDPGCKVDTVLALESDQGYHKSSALEELAGHTHFGCDMPPITSKDAKEYLQGKWLVEIAELEALSRADVKAIKAFITTRTDKFRPSYGRRTIEAPRRCVFVISTNDAEYLHDATGGRRFWPVRVRQKIGKGTIAAIREQLLAEAVHAYREGRPWWLDSAELESLQAAEVEERYDADPIEETIAEWVAHYSTATEFKRTFSTGDLLWKCLQIEAKDHNKSIQGRVGKALRRLGYEKARVWSGERRGLRVWLHASHLTAWKRGDLVELDAGQDNGDDGDDGKRWN